jgi:hypothetical protein
MVPLDQVYAASDQSGLRRFPQKWQEAATDMRWGEICKSLKLNGSSNAILVCGDEIEEAISSAHWVLCSGADAAAAYSAKKAPRPVWLVAFLGNADIRPLEWTVESVAVEGRQIRLTYRPRDQAEEVLALFVRLCYDFWAPLPKLTPGVYTVELYDMSEKAVTFSRRVTVER